MDLSGHCLCGTVTFQAADVESHLHACHCSMCRRWNGGPAFAAETGTFTVTSGQAEIREYDSSAWAARGFCTVCGSNLYYRLKPDRYIVWAGAFDEQPFQLSGEIFCDEKPSGYDFAGEHPRHAGLPPGVGADD